MGPLPAGALVLVPFPFSDLTQSKLRPAIVLASAGRGDLILCQVTSNAYSDPLAIRMEDTDLRSGSLRRTSYVRPGKLFAANASLIVARIGDLRSDLFERILTALIDLLEAG